MPVAKIVILNWNGAEHLRRFLPSVVAAARAPPARRVFLLFDRSSAL